MAIIEFILFLLGVALLFTSFLMGKDNKQKLQNKVDSFCQNIEKSSVNDIIKSTAEVFAFGFKLIYSRNLFVRSYIISFILFFLLLIVFCGGLSEIGQIGQTYGETWLIFFIIIMPVNAVIDYLSVRLSRFLLTNVSKSKSFLELITFLSIEVFLGFIFYFIPMNAEVLLEVLLDDPNQGFMKNSEALFTLLTNFISSGDVKNPMQGFVLALSFSGFLPTLIFFIAICVIMLFVFIKILLPKQMLFLLNRLRETNSSYIATAGSIIILISNFLGKLTKLL